MLGRFNFSTPTTMTTSAKPAAMNAYAYRKPTVPRAHLCSVRADSVRGRIPRVSAASGATWL